MIFVLLMLGCCNFVSASDSGTSLPAGSNDGQEPSYVVVTRVLNPRINKGDTLEIEVYFSGYGHVDRAKLQTFYAPGVPDPTKSGQIKHVVMDEDLNVFTKDSVLDEVGIWAGLSESYFQPDSSFPSDHMSDPNKCGVVRVRGEMKRPEGAPLTLKINTFRVAPFGLFVGSVEGDNELQMTLTYTSGNSTFTYPHTVRFHINSFWEEFGGYTQALFVGLAFIGFATFLYEVYKWLKNRKGTGNKVEDSKDGEEGPPSENRVSSSKKRSGRKQ
jgi:hypothetical protein